MKIIPARNFLKSCHLIWLFSLLFILLGISLFIFTLESEDLDFKDIFRNENQRSASGIIKICTDQFSWRGCYGEQLGRLTGRIGFGEVVKVLDEIMRIDARANDCHLISHEIAAAEAKKDPDNWLSMFKVVNQDMCMGGYIHGAVEGKKLIDSSMKIDETTIPQICESITRASGNKNIDPCAHVMGHILLVEHRVDMKKASEVCDKLPNSAMQSYCNNGMFMENITRTNLANHGFNEPFFISEPGAEMVQKKCSEFKGIAETSCWRELAHVYVDLANKNLKGVWALCSRAPSENNRNECYLHSFNSILPLASFEVSQLAGICDPIGSDSVRKNRCYSWAIRTFLLSSKNLTPKAVAVCAQNTEYREQCYKILGKNLVDFYSVGELKNVCSEVDERYKGSCECLECRKKAN